jgi:hypothetical protein
MGNIKREGTLNGTALNFRILIPHSKCQKNSELSRFHFPDPKHISASFSERHNLTIRRFTRLTNAHSKKIENHEHAIALNFMHYNFCKIHSTLRVTPAMAAGLSKSVWEIEDLVALID